LPALALVLPLSLALPAIGAPPGEAGDVRIRGRSISIGRGRFPVQSLLGLLSGTTGLPLLQSSIDPGIEGREVVIVNDIKNADEAILKAILEANGVRVFRETLASGAKVLKAESMAADQISPEDPRPSPIVRVPSDPAPTTVTPQNARQPAAGPVASRPEGMPEVERRLEALELKVDGVLEGLREVRDALGAAGVAARGTLDARRRARLAEIDRIFQERWEALRKERREAIRKLLAEMQEPPGPAKAAAPSPINASREAGGRSGSE
jgi:hypothetical protein